VKDLTYRVQMSGAVKGEQVLMNHHFPLVHDERVTRANDPCMNLSACASTH
jgi:hypothetical protein